MESVSYLEVGVINDNVLSFTDFLENILQDQT